MPEVKRQTAYKCSIKMILEGNYIQRPGWDPNYIQINGMQISRINILAVVVGKEGNSFTIDDGTGQIQTVFFGEQNKYENISVGNPVQIIGRPREYNQRKFIVPEIIKIVEDSRWIDYRKLELSIQENNFPKSAAEQTPAKSEDSEQKDSSEPVDENESRLEQEKIESEQRFEDNYAVKIISTIRKLDKGDGANINDVIKQSGLEKADKYIISLINEGEIFEIRTGKIKILE